MTVRVDIRRYLGSSAGQAMLGLSKVADESGLDRSLLDLVKVRGSQINRCAHCIDMHTKDARANGESEQRLYALDAWRETPFFSDRERAALEWTETLTRIADNQVPDDVYERVAAHFSDDELVALTMAVVVINAWNRIAITFRVPVGTYQPHTAVA